MRGRLKGIEKQKIGVSSSCRSSKKKEDLGKERVRRDKEQALSLNMHISSTGDGGAAGGEKVAGECERTLTDRWSQHAVSFD